MRWRRRIAAPAAIAVVVCVTACAPAMPETVVPGSSISVGWSGEFTSANAAAAPTTGNVEIAAATRAGFGVVLDGEFVPDEGFGTITIVRDDPFTVRYDLAEPVWSDGIPLDAADLLLGWAAASGRLDGGDAADVAAPVPGVPVVDEFARALDVAYPLPVDDWQQRVEVAVPAHVVGLRALGLDDAMEAKQAVITAIRDADADALAAIAEVWHEGFALPADGAIPSDLLLSSGPFRVDAVSGDADGQSVALVPNAAYRGLATPQVAAIRLVPAGSDPLAEVGDRLDVVGPQPPRASDREPVDALERRDAAVDTSHDGTAWAVLLDPAGVFATPAARAAFLRAIPARDLIDRGGGTWASSYTATASMLSTPGSRAYDVVTEDSGFTAALTGADEPLREREAAGVPSGAQVCVLYDRTSEFAVGAFAALGDAAREAGWIATDCGTDDLAAALALGGWDAAIARVPIPQTAAQIAAQWGSAAQGPLAFAPDPERDALLAQLAQTTDVYAARDLRAQIEATIVRAAVALPIAMNPTVTIVDKGVTGVASRAGTDASLMSGAVQWAVVP